MSRQIENSKTILSASAADVAAANATWYDIEGPDQIAFDIQITGAVNVKLDFDLHNNNSASSQSEYTANAQVVLDDPMGQVRAFCNNCGAGEAATVKMRRIFHNQR